MICKRSLFECSTGNTALVQGIRCEPLGEHLIPWTCAVFFRTARKKNYFTFSQTTVQIFQRRKKCTVDRHGRRPSGGDSLTLSQ